MRSGLTADCRCWCGNLAVARGRCEVACGASVFLPNCEGLDYFLLAAQPARPAPPLASEAARSAESEWAFAARVRTHADLATIEPALSRLPAGLTPMIRPCSEEALAPSLARGSADPDLTALITSVRASAFAIQSGPAGD